MIFRSDVSADLVQHTGGDLSVVNAARVSTLGERVTALPGEAGAREKGLINYLMRDRHGSPFEHGSMTFLVCAPVFVAREFMRHRAGWSYNEESGRYRELRAVFYVPSRQRRLVQTGRPGEYDFVPGTPEQHALVGEVMEDSYRRAYAAYQEMLGAGIAREVARCVLPVGVYTSFYATCNARSLMHFLSLRTRREHAGVPSFPQREIEMVAERMEAEWARLMPLTWKAFNGHGRVAP